MIHSVPPYSLGGILSNRGATWAIRIVMLLWHIRQTPPPRGAVSRCASSRSSQPNIWPSGFPPAGRERAHRRQNVMRLGPDRAMPSCPWVGGMHGSRPGMLQPAMRPARAIEFDAHQQSIGHARSKGRQKEVGLCQNFVKRMINGPRYSSPKAFREFPSHCRWSQHSPLLGRLVGHPCKDGISLAHSSK
jgi:hypothetical protein